MFFLAHLTEGTSIDSSIVSSMVFSSESNSGYAALCLNASFMLRTLIAHGTFADTILSKQ